MRWTRRPESWGAPPRCGARPSPGQSASRGRSNSYPAGGFVREKQAGQLHIGRLGDLDVTIAARDNVDLHVQPFDQAGLVGADEPVLPRFIEGPLQQVVTE